MAKRRFKLINLCCFLSGCTVPSRCGTMLTIVLPVKRGRVHGSFNESLRTGSAWRKCSVQKPVYRGEKIRREKISLKLVGSVRASREFLHGVSVTMTGEWLNSLYSRYLVLISIYFYDFISPLTSIENIHVHQTLHINAR